jgi:hypothetical protein
MVGQIVTLKFSLFLLLVFFMAGCSSPMPVDTLSREVETPDAPLSIVAENQQGYPIELRSLTYEEGQIRAAFCFILATSDDWQIGLSPNDVVMASGDFMSTSDRGGLINRDQVKGATRCIYRLFPA